MKQRIMIMIIVSCPALLTTYRICALKGNISFLELICLVTYTYILMKYIDDYTRWKMDAKTSIINVICGYMVVVSLIFICMGISCVADDDDFPIKYTIAIMSPLILLMIFYLLI